MTTTALASPLGSADPRNRDRIRDHTPTFVNDTIDTLTAASATRALSGGRDAIVARLKELEYEWDADRAVVLNFAIVGGLSSLLGEKNQGWKMFFRTQQAFLLLHTVVGWCPPLSLFRRLGFRTWQEITSERMLLEQALDEHGGRER